MSDFTWVVGPGSDETTVELPSNMTSFSFLDGSDPGLPASNSQLSEWVKVVVKGKVGRSVWFFPSKTTWTAKIEWRNLSTPHTISFFAS